MFHFINQEEFDEKFFLLYLSIQTFELKRLPPMLNIEMLIFKHFKKFISVLD